MLKYCLLYILTAVLFVLYSNSVFAADFDTIEGCPRERVVESNSTTIIKPEIDIRNLYPYLLETDKILVAGNTGVLHAYKLFTNCIAKQRIVTWSALDGITNEMLLCIMHCLDFKDLKSLGAASRKFQHFFLDFKKNYVSDSDKLFNTQNSDNFSTNLSNLRVFRLKDIRVDFSDLEGSITKMVQLRELDVRDCRLVRDNFGEFCKLISQLPNLRSLNLSAVVPEGINFSDLKNAIIKRTCLRELDVSKCRAVRINFESFCNLISTLPYLRILNLSAVVPKSADAIILLKSAIHNNREHSKFCSLDLSNNDFDCDNNGDQIIGTLYEILRELNIEKLSLAHCQMKNPMLASLSLVMQNSDNFCSLNLSGIKITDKQMGDLSSTFSSLENLRTLILRGSIGSLATLNMLLKYLPELKPLRILDISNNSFKEQTGMLHSIAQTSLVSAIIPSVAAAYKSEAFKAVDLLAALVKKLSICGLGLANCDLGDRELKRFCQTLLQKEDNTSVKLIDLNLYGNPFSFEVLSDNMNNLLMNFKSIRNMKLSVQSVESKKKLMQLKEAYFERNLFIDICEIK